MGARLRDTFGSLRVRNFRLFIAGQVVSTIGTWMQLVAQAWLVLELTHSGTALGIDTAMSFLPILLFGAWGGVIADRFDNRRVEIVTQAAFAVLAAALFVLVGTGAVRVWMVYALSFATGCVTAVDMPTRQSFYLELVGPEHLTNAMSLNTATFTGSRLIGPVVAAILIGTVGTGPVFLVNAVSYAAVVFALVAMRPSEFRPRRRAARSRGQIREGFRYVVRTPELWLPLAIMASLFVFAYNWAVLFPLLATRTFGGDEGTYGTLQALFGAGSLLGALFVASRINRPNVPRLAGLAVAVGVLLLGVALAPVFALEWVLVPALGAASIAFAITGNSTLQLSSSEEMRGRVMSLYSIAFLGSTPIGGPIVGWVGEHLGPRVALAGGGVIALVTGLVATSALGMLRRPPRGDDEPAFEAATLSRRPR